MCCTGSTECVVQVGLNCVVQVSCSNYILLVLVISRLPLLLGDCKRCAVLFESAIGTYEIINCQSVQAQVRRFDFQFNFVIAEPEQNLCEPENHYIYYFHVDIENILFTEVIKT